MGAVPGISARNINRERKVNMRGYGRVFTRGKRWWIAYYVRQGGRSVEVRESAGDTQAKAGQVLRQWVREVGAHDLGLRSFRGPQQERVIVEALLRGVERDYQIQKRRSLPQFRSHLRHIRVFFGMDRAFEMTTACEHRSRTTARDRQPSPVGR